MSDRKLTAAIFATGERVQVAGRRKLKFEPFASALVGHRTRWHVPPSVLLTAPGSQLVDGRRDQDASKGRAAPREAAPG